MGITAEPERFYDPELGRPSRANVHLVRDNTSGFELWRLGQRIAYEDRELGEIAVPRDTAGFTTDLTSVPQLLTWLVSKSGTHLPAALVHDALTPPFSETDADGNSLPDWIGPEVTRLQGDRVFRDAMADVGTPPIQRWLIWSGVSIPTAWTLNKAQAIVAWTSLLVIGLLGWLATLDLFDQIDLLPWMGEQSWNRELIYGGLFAIAIPVPIGFFVWPSGVKRAGMIVGVAIAVLLHVTLAVGAVTVAYQLAEKRLKFWAPPQMPLKIFSTLAALAMVALTIWICVR